MPTKYVHEYFLPYLLRCYGHKVTFITVAPLSSLLAPPRIPLRGLQALRVPLVGNLAGRARLAASRTTEALSTTLAPLGSAVAASTAVSRLRSRSSSRLGVAAAAIVRRGANVDSRAAAGEVPLGGNDLVVVSSESEASSGPGVEVVGHVDRATGALALADAPVLVKGSSAVDRGLVDTSRLVDAVGSAIAGEGAHLGSTGRGVVGAKVLDDVVLDERAPGPAVDGKVRVAVGLVGTGVVDGSVIEC